MPRINDDDLEFYADKFGSEKSNTRNSRKRSVKRKIDPIQELAETSVGLENGLKITYRPGLFEESWLTQSLQSFFDMELINDILASVRGGKEASVYCCVGTPALGRELLAAKIYRPRMFRQLRNDKAYRDGRPILTGEGRAVKETDHRIMRAINKKTAFGSEVSHSSWLLYEYTTLKTLREAGAAVPAVYAVNDNAILMDYIGDARRAAPTLNTIHLSVGEARHLFNEVMRNIDLMLSLGYVHGDLSAYNILYWEGRITLIDFPQVTLVESNPNAEKILQRDIERVCEYFGRYGVDKDAYQIFSRFKQGHRLFEVHLEDLPEADEE